MGLTESILVGQLNKYLGQYLTGITKKNLDVGLLWGGTEFKNVGISKNLPQLLNLPFKIEYSSIGLLKTP